MRLTADDVVELAEIGHAVGERHEAASSGTSSVTCSDVCSRRHKRWRYYVFQSPQLDASTR
jgi:hypothetical protein